MKIGCVCPTYKRPKLLGRAINCFLQQTYTNAYLVVLDDAGQYKSQKHEHWQLVSRSDRFRSLGGKRQAGIDLLPPDCDGYMAWDDDDVYFPSAVASVASALRKAVWAQCRLVYETAGPNLLAVTKAFGGCDPITKRERWGYGGCWSYRLVEHQAVDGYEDNPARSSNDDLDLARKFFTRYGASADSTADGQPWYWYNRDPGVNKISDEGVGFWERRGRLPFRQAVAPLIGWNGPNLYEYCVLDESPRLQGWMEK